MITDRDVEKLKTVFATKDDLKWFATKYDLKEVRDDVKEIKVTLDKMMNVFDGFAKRFDFHDMEYAALKISDDRQNDQLDQLAKHTHYRFRL